MPARKTLRRLGTGMPAVTPVDCSTFNRIEARVAETAAAATYFRSKMACGVEGRVTRGLGTCGQAQLPTATPPRHGQQQGAREGTSRHGTNAHPAGAARNRSGWRSTGLACRAGASRCPPPPAHGRPEPAQPHNGPHSRTAATRATTSTPVPTAEARAMGCGMHPGGSLGVPPFYNRLPPNGPWSRPTRRPPPPPRVARS